MIGFARVWVLMLFAASAVLLGTAEARAHAVLVGSEPADGAALSEGPSTAILRFNEPVTPIAVRLLDSNGAPVDGTGKAVRHDSEVHLPLPSGLTAGFYILSFRVTSLDSHPVAASVVFSVGQPAQGEAEAEALRTRLDAPSASALPAYLNLALHYASLLFAAGTALFLAMFNVPERHVTAVEVAVRRAALVGIATAALSIGLGGARIAGAGLGDLLTPAVWAVGAAATLGTSAAIAFVALGGLLLASGFSDRKPKLAMFAACGMLAVASLAFTGHVVQAKPTWLTVPAVVVHAAMACFWFGALWPLIVVLRGDPAEAAALLAQFSRRAVLTMALLVAAAVVLTVLQTVSLGAFIGTDYGILLLGKIALVALILTLAAVNKWRLVPAIARGNLAARRHLRATIGVEGALGAAVIAVTAALGLTPPPRALDEAAQAAKAADPQAAHLALGPAAHRSAHQADAARRPSTFVARANGIDVVATVTPARPGANAIELAFGKADGTAFDPKEVAIELAKPDSGIEAIERKAQRAAPGKFKVNAAELVVAGAWELKIAALVDDFTRQNIAMRITVDRPGAAPSRPTDRRTVTYGALSIARGQVLYADNCVACHGAEGYGDGPAAAALARRPSNLTEDHLFHHDDDTLFDWISNGIPDTPMPAFGGFFSEVERWDVLNFLRAQAEAEHTNAMTADVSPWRPLTAPDFVFRIPPGPPETLKEQRGRSVVLLVLYGAGSKERLVQLEAVHEALAKTEVRVVAVPMTTEPRPASWDDAQRSPLAALANDEAVAAYTLFRRVPTVEGVLAMPTHMEFLIDRQGYLRARWIPGEGEGWGDVQALLNQVRELAREPPRPRASDEHVTLK